MTAPAAVWHRKRIPANAITTAHTLALNGHDEPIARVIRAHNGLREQVIVHGTSGYACRYELHDLVDVAEPAVELSADELLAEHGHVPSPTAQAAQAAALRDTLTAARILEQSIGDAARQHAEQADQPGDAATLARAHARGGTFWLALALARLRGTPLAAADIATAALADARDARKARAARQTEQVA